MNFYSNFYSKRGRLKGVLATLVGIGLTGMPALAASPGGVSSGLTEWFDAGSGVTGSSGNLSWSRKGYDSSVATLSFGTLTELIESGTSGTSAPITLVPGIVNFNAGFRFGNRSYFGSKTGAAETLFSEAGITAVNAGSGFSVGYTSDQLLTNSLGTSLTGTCGTDRCDVGTRTSATQFGGATKTGGSGNANYAATSTDGPTANLYGFWASATATGSGSSHTNTRNGMTNTGTAVTKVTDNNYIFRIGSFPGYTYFNSAAGSTGAITEGIYYNRELTTIEAQKVSSYLAIKYGITLDTNATRNDTTSYDYINSSGTTVWSGTNGTFSPYHNNVFGIGRDVNSALNQMISTSVNNGGAVGTFALDILTLANGSSVGSTGPSAFNYLVQTDSTGQAAGTGTSLNDGQFLMIGNDAGSTTTTTSASVGSATNTLINGTWTRLDRRWIAQNTGSVGNVSLNFNLPVAAVTALGNNLKNVVLLVDNDGNYANGGTRVITNRVISGNQISFNTTLSNSEVFTVAFTTPTVTIKKTTVGVATGSSNTFNFNITATNTATSTTTNTYTPAVTVTGSTTTTGTANNIDFNTDVSISETIPSGFGLSALVCTNATVGGPAFTPTYNLATGTATIPAAMISADAAITCAFTNALKMDLSITKTDGSSTYIQGKPQNYTIVVSNAGPSTATNASFTDPAITGLTVNSVTCGSATGGATCPTAGNTTVAAMQGAGIAIPSLPSGGSVTFTVNATPAAGTTGNLTNTAAIKLTGATDPTPADNTASDTDTLLLPAMCTANTAYIPSGGKIVALDTTTGVTTIVGAAPANSGPSLAMALNGDAYFIAALAGISFQVTRWNASTGISTQYTLPETNAAVSVRAGFNPSTGYFYWTTSPTLTTNNLFAFNTNTNSYVGQVGVITSTVSGSSGDLIFDSLGSMLMLVGGASGAYEVIRVDSIPTTAGTSALSGQTLTNAIDTGGNNGGFAANADGTFYVGLSIPVPAGSAKLYRVNPNSGALLGNVDITGDITVLGNLATCGTPGTLKLQKNIVRRVSSNHQFTLKITGNGITTANTATTTGSTTGVQASTIVGAITGLAGTSYTITETAGNALTSLSSYVATYSCVNTTTNAVVASGTGTSATFVFPSATTVGPNILCTITNNAGDLSLVKTGPTIVQPNSSLTYTLTVTNSTSVSVPTTTLTDTLPAGTTFVSASDSGTHSAGTVTWNLGTVAANTTKVVTVTITSPDLTAVKAGNKTLINTATVSSSPSDSNAANNTSSATTQIAIAELVKQVRNVSTANAFATINSGLPSQILEYCIDFYNRGNIALNNFILTDNVPANITALLTGYDADEPSATTGFGVKLVRSATTYLSSATDADLGSLNTTGGTFANGLLTVNLGVLAIAETGQACFKGTVR